MNSQQELLDAINTISQNRDKSFDTPATVLRVEGDTVWVHIDGGADETPVNKTISCAEGETVQVRISNGSAFLVGNASAPPTDDKTANVAHFVAEQADEKATEAIKSVNAIVQTVEGKVDSGDSNITDISSTMYQDAYGVNIFNDTLAVGDSYAHIDGDSFDIKQATTAGTIDNTNDTLIASFGREVTVGNRNAGTFGDYSQVYGIACVASGKFSHAEGRGAAAGGDYSHAEGQDTIASGDYSHAEGHGATASKDYSHAEGGATEASGYYSHAEGYATKASGDFGSHTEGNATKASGTSSHAEGGLTEASGNYSHAQNFETIAASDYQTVIGKFNVSDANDTYALIIGNGTAAGLRSDALKIKWNGDVIGRGGNKISPTILTSSSISASATSYTFNDNAITADSTIDIYDTIFGFAPSNIQTSAGSCTVTFPAQSSSHQIKLFVF